MLDWKLVGTANLGADLTPTGGFTPREKEGICSPRPAESLPALWL